MRGPARGVRAAKSDETPYWSWPRRWARCRKVGVEPRQRARPKHHPVDFALETYVGADLIAALPRRAVGPWYATGGGVEGGEGGEGGEDGEGGGRAEADWAEEDSEGGRDGDRYWLSHDVQLAYAARPQMQPSFE